MFLLDIRYDPKNSQITKWIKDGPECRSVREVFYPKIYISGKPELLPLIAAPYSQPARCERYTFGREEDRLGSEPEKVISATMELNSFYEIAFMLEAKGCNLFNIDLDPVRQYLLEYGIFPAAKLKGDVLDDCQYTLDLGGTRSYEPGTLSDVTNILKKEAIASIVMEIIRITIISLNAFSSIHKGPFWMLILGFLNFLSF